MADPPLSPDPPICAGGAPVWTRQAAPRPGSGAGAGPVPGRCAAGGPAERSAITHLGGSGLTGVLLVGGASRRFGSPKALARLGGETLAERAWRLLGEACGERIAVGKAADGLELPFPLLDDGSEVRAPLAGVVAGLRAASGEVAVILPVDCPLLDADALRALAAACRDVAVPQTGPLPGAYHRRALPLLERRLAAGQLRLRDAVAGLDVAVVELDRALLVNVNEPADLERLRLGS